MDVDDIFIDKICRKSLCGSQRCDGTDEWLSGCKLYKEFLQRINNEDIDYVCNDILDNLT